MKACQTCLELITDEMPKFNLRDIYLDGNNREPSADTTSIQYKLLYCVPELVLDNSKELVLCQSCASSLSVAYKFKQKCLEAQDKINRYVHQMPVNTGPEVTEIALHYKRLEHVASGGYPITMFNSQTVELPPPTIQNEMQPTASDGNTQNESLPIWLSTNLEFRAKYSCNECDFEIDLFSKFCFHMIVHDNEKYPNKCNQCEFTSGDRKVVQDHMKNHMREKKLYKCTHCNMRSDNRRDMISHSYKHRQYFDSECHVCKWKFPNKIELAMHMKDHSRYNTLTCKECNFTCYIQQKLDRHMKTHSSGYQKCTVCSFAANTAEAMRRHMDRKHQNVNVGVKNQYGPNSWGRNSQQPGSSGRQH